MCWVFTAAHWLSLVAVSGGSSLGAVRGLLFVVSFPSFGVGALGTCSSVITVGRLSGAKACEILAPRPGIEPVSPALAGRPENQ